MAFNEKTFLNTQFEARTQAVYVKNLKDFFDEGEEPVFVVKGLSSSEIFNCRNAKKKQETIAQLLKAVESSENSELARVAEELQLVSTKNHEQVLINKRLIMSALIKPVLSENAINKLMSEQHGVFSALTAKIIDLSEKGFSKKN